MTICLRCVKSENTLETVDSYIQIHSRAALVDSDLRIHCFSCVLPNVIMT